MGWSSDLESGGRGFDSRPPEGHFGVICSSIFGCLGMCLGVLWGCFRIGLGWFCKKCRTGWKIQSFKMTGSIVPESGYLRIASLAYPRLKISRCLGDLRVSHSPVGKCRQAKLGDLVGVIFSLRSYTVPLEFLMNLCQLTTFGHPKGLVP